jgi:trans-aconitate methyltransferase
VVSISLGVLVALNVTPMKIHEYKDYDEYIEKQKSTTKKKYGRLRYARESVIHQIAELHKSEVSNVLCHGARSGEEQEYFKNYYSDAYVIGTELSPLAKNVKMTRIHDFNKPIEEWIGKFDIIYSNSFDHTITPQETMNVWLNQLSPNGRLYIEWSETQNGKSHEMDPFSAKEDEIINLASDKYIISSRADGAKHPANLIIFGAQ